MKRRTGCGVQGLVSPPKVNEDVEWRPLGVLGGD